MGKIKPHHPPGGVAPGERREDMTKYPMKNKTDRPLFEYLVRDNMHLDYYLFDEFDKALKQAEKMSISDGRHILIYENYFNTKTRESFSMG